MGVRLSDVGGLVRLATTGTVRVTEVVETVHAEVLRGPRLGPRPAPLRAAGLPGLVYGLVRGIATFAGGALDVPLGWLAPVLDPPPAADEGTADEGTRDEGTPDEGTAFRAVLNGVVGDHLHATGNPLALTLSFRHAGRVLRPDRAHLAAVLPPRPARVVVFVHGLCHDETSWTRDGRDYGTRLAHDLGVVPVYVRYNSGLNVSTNGRALSRGLAALAAAWPCPLEELVLVGHSMGGLVARSACHDAAVSGAAWARALRTVVCLGTPHHGAPLERLGHVAHALLDRLPYTAGLGRLGRARSAGITDLRHGNVLDEHWQGRDRFQFEADRCTAEQRAAGPRAPARLPGGVLCHAIAGTRGRCRGDVRDRVLGDGLVDVASALGEHDDPDRAIACPATRFIACETGHLDLLGSDVVYEQIRRVVDGRER